jgi:hypothetical protein
MGRMSKELFDIERKIITFLCNNHGFVIEEEIYDPNSFGNEIITLKSNKIKIRFIKDRGDFSINISSLKHYEWYPIEQILQLLGVYKNPNANNKIALEVLNELLLKNVNKIKELFSEEKIEITNEKLLKINQELINEMFGEHIKNDK